MYSLRRSLGSYGGLPFLGGVEWVKFSSVRLRVFMYASMKRVSFLSSMYLSMFSGRRRVWFLSVLLCM